MKSLIPADEAYVVCEKAQQFDMLYAEESTNLGELPVQRTRNDQTNNWQVIWSGYLQDGVLVRME